jgi:threonine dehydrogenase-like Zn-dependent dehydrogenase
MKALTWHGKHDIRCESVSDPTIEQGRDATIKVTACAICGVTWFGRRYYDA